MPADYESLYNELLGDYLGSEYYPLPAKNAEYKTDLVEAHTLDEYLSLLIKGYINASLRVGLDKHWMELLEDEWFLQWPLVRWSYATRLFHGQGCRANKKHAVKILLSLAKDGCPCAIHNIGICHRFSDGLEFKYELAICLWIEASKRGYYKAWEDLYNEYQMSFSKGLCDELRLIFLYEVFTGLLRSRNATRENYIQKFDEKEQDEIKQIYNEGKRIQKRVREKLVLRFSAALFFDDTDNPYNIDF